jgi:hypothetical protein
MTIIGSGTTAANKIENRFELCLPSWRPTAGRVTQAVWGTYLMTSIRPDDSDPIPLRASPHRMGTLMIRFVGLLFLTVAVLALLYSR